MRPIAIVLFLACAIAGNVASAQAVEPVSEKAFEVASLLRELESAVNLAGGLSVRASKPALREGESLVLTFELPSAGYFNVVSINPAGEPTVLFPNQFQADNKVEAGSFTLPGPQKPFDLQASAPYGESRVLAFLTSEPLNLYELGEGERNSAGALLARFARLSSVGRDLISQFATRDLQTKGAQGPMAAGTTTVRVCTKTGPCDAPAAGAGGVPNQIRRIVDAVLPGIFFDKGADLLQGKALVLRPLQASGLKLTKVSEGFVPHLYEDAAGHCTIAYGHLLKLGRCDGSSRQRYNQGIDEADASRLLTGDLAIAQRAVQSLVKTPLTDGQYAALVDFTFNVGIGNLKRSTLLKAINAQQHHRVPFQMRRWTRAGNRELRGLRTRRDREIALYFDGMNVPKALPEGEDLTPVDIRLGEARN